MAEKGLQKYVAIYQNSTGMAEVMEALCKSGGIPVVRVKTKGQLLTGMNKGLFELLLADMDFGVQSMENVRLIKELRESSKIPIMIVASQGSEEAKIMAFTAGADDYVTTECHPMELLARIKCQLSRYRLLTKDRLMTNNEIFRVEELEIDDAQRKVTVDGREVKLTPIEYKILRLLAMERGNALSISQIYEKIWHMQAIGADNTIAVHIRHIREKIERNPAQPKYLKVVWGTGYKVG